MMTAIGQAIFSRRSDAVSGHSALQIGRCRPGGTVPGKCRAEPHFCPASQRARGAVDTLEMRGSRRAISLCSTTGLISVERSVLPLGSAVFWKQSGNFLETAANQPRKWKLSVKFLETYWKSR